MSYCINPACPQPQNPNSVKKCQACGSELILRDRYKIIKPLGPESDIAIVCHKYII